MIVDFELDMVSVSSVSSLLLHFHTDAAAAAMKSKLERLNLISCIVGLSKDWSRF